MRSLEGFRLGRRMLFWVMTAGMVTCLSGPITQAAPEDPPQVAGYPPVASAGGDGAAMPGVGPQAVDVVFVDDDAAGDLVMPADGFVSRLNGLEGDPIRFTEAMATPWIPVGYRFARLVGDPVFDSDDFIDQTITVHLVHNVLSGRLITTRTIHYTGAGDLTPPDVVMPVTWDVTIDFATGAVKYSTDSPGYPEVRSPPVTGYAPDAGRVAAGSLRSPVGVEPTSSRIIVTYAPVAPAPGGQSGGPVGAPGQVADPGQVANPGQVADPGGGPDPGEGAGQAAPAAIQRQLVVYTGGLGVRPGAVRTLVLVGLLTIILGAVGAAGVRRLVEWDPLIRGAGARAVAPQDAASDAGCPSGCEDEHPADNLALLINR